MSESILQQIDHVVEIIYSMDKAGLDQAFIGLLDSLAGFTQQMEPEETSPFNGILLSLQLAYTKRDLVELADVLLYELKIFFGGEAYGMD